MPEDLNVSEDDIAYAERILLPEGKRFCPQRRAFIKNLDTIDLQAVPGSGKTTALLAKLLILERKMPFDNGSGVLVISHTNAAVEEIEKRIKQYCPLLFSYPNFIGTIQSFVDQFLAIPNYIHKFGHKPYRIDNEIYDEKAEKYFNAMPVKSSAKLYLSRMHEPHKLFASLRFDQELNIITGINGNVLLKAEKNSASYKQLKRAKVNLANRGYLHFEDAYFWAERCVNKFPKIKELISRRFPFVFVDEMQDMDKHQYEILETLFGSSIPCFQRIGDKNQSIYSKSTIGSDCVYWKDRHCKDTQERKVLKITGSHRLTPENAKVVKCFGLETLEVEGKRQSLGVKPHLIVFDDPLQVLPTYAQIISELRENGVILDYVPSEKPIACIGWRSEHEENDLFGIKDYFPNFQRSEAVKNKIDYTTLSSYIPQSLDDSTLANVRKRLLNALLKVLRIEEINDKERKNRNFTKSRLLQFLRENHENLYTELKTQLYNWSLDVVKGKQDSVLSSMKSYVPKFVKEGFDLESLSESSVSFLNGEKEEADNALENAEAPSNEYECSETGVRIKVGTVHSAKGQTHTSTLYLESYYNGRKGLNGYESERLISQFLGCNFPDSENSDKKRHMESTKMAYVGLSRPTHLLCFAIHKNRFEPNRQHFSDLDNWVIRE